MLAGLRLQKRPLLLTEFATFAGNLQSGSNPDAGANEGALIRKNGRIQLASNQGSTPIWSGYTVGVSSPTSTIKADGSATFGATIDVTNGASGVKNISMNNTPSGGALYVRDGNGDVRITLNGYDGPLPRLLMTLRMVGTGMHPLL